MTYTQLNMDVQSQCCKYFHMLQFVQAKSESEDAGGCNKGHTWMILNSNKASLFLCQTDVEE